MAEARCRCMEKWNRCWKGEEKRKYKLCESAPRTAYTCCSREVNLENILRDKRDEKAERWLKEIKWEKESRSKKPEGGELINRK